MTRYVVRYATDHVSQDWAYLAAVVSLRSAEELSAFYESQGRHVEILEDTYVIVRTAIVYNSISGRL